MKLTKIVFIFFISAQVFAASKTLDLELSKNKIEFIAIGNPSALRIKGRAEDGNGLKGKLFLDGFLLTGSASFELKEFDTGITTRNQHMKEKYLETDKFPIATMKINKLLLPKEGIVENLPFEGVLSLHGVSKPINGSIAIKNNENLFEAKFIFKLKIEDFEIKIPSFMGITMANEVSVNIETKGSFVQ